MSQSPQNYDVIIVGGGPSGVTAAIGIARQGYSCVILDKKSRDRIGDKNCGDALDDKHVQILLTEMNLDPPSIERGEARDLITTITLAAGSLGTKFTAKVPGYLVDRLVYGQRLLQTAENEGVTILANSTVRGLIIDENQVVGLNYFDKTRVKQSLRSKIIIDASGFVGVVRKELPLSMTLDIDLTFLKKWTIGTYREIIELNQKEDHDFREEIVLIYHKDIPPPGYAWIFSEGEKKLNIGITWVKNDPYPENKSLKQLYHEILDPYFDPDDYTVLYSGGGNIPMRPNFDSLVFNGVLIVGDAGGLVDPTTFEGHGPALESGRLAAIASIQALEKNSFTIKDLWPFNKLIMDYPGGMHAQSFLAARLIREIGVDNLAFLLNRKIIDQEELEEVFQNSQEIPLILKIKKFIIAFPKWGLMLKLRKYINLIEKTGEIYSKYPEEPSNLDQWRKQRNKIMGYSF